MTVVLNNKYYTLPDKTEVIKIISVIRRSTICLTKTWQYVNPETRAQQSDMVKMTWNPTMLASCKSEKKNIYMYLFFTFWICFCWEGRGWFCYCYFLMLAHMKLRISVLMLLIRVKCIYNINIINFIFLFI